MTVARCLNLFWLLQQSARDGTACKQQKCISYGFGGWKSKIRSPADLMSGENPRLGSWTVGLWYKSHHLTHEGSAFTTCPKGRTSQSHHREG